MDYGTENYNTNWRSYCTKVFSFMNIYGPSQDSYPAYNKSDSLNGRYQGFGENVQMTWFLWHTVEDCLYI